uniref:Probable cell surface glycoprotein, related n=2 Tax=Neospora caninum (strain Liverpool) TaxID=572307 RepID=A0A0F7UAS3_NEOCL|nr:TPA: Probable cell surface glycoprotein, related [Neospora caninum Liverpool]
MEARKYEWGATTARNSFAERAGLTGAEADILFKEVTLEMLQRTCRLLRLNHKLYDNWGVRFSAIAEGFFSVITSDSLRILPIFRRHLELRPELRKAFSKNPRLLALIDKQGGAGEAGRVLLAPWVPPGTDGAAEVAAVEGDVDAPMDWQVLADTFQDYFASITAPGSGFQAVNFFSSAADGFSDFRASFTRSVTRHRSDKTQRTLAAVIARAALGHFLIARFDAVHAAHFGGAPASLSVTVQRNKLAEAIQVGLAKAFGASLEPAVFSEMLENLFSKAAGGAVLEAVHNQQGQTGSAVALSQVANRAASDVLSIEWLTLLDVWLSEHPNILQQLPENSVLLALLPSRSQTIVTKHQFDVPAPPEEGQQPDTAVEPYAEFAPVVEPLVKFDQIPSDDDEAVWITEMRASAFRIRRKLVVWKEGLKDPDLKDATALMQCLVALDLSIGHYRYLDTTYAIFDRSEAVNPAIASLVTEIERHWQQLGVVGEGALDLRRYLLASMVTDYRIWHESAPPEPRTPEGLFRNVYNKFAQHTKTRSLRRPVLAWAAMHPGVLENMPVQQPSPIVRLVHKWREAGQAIEAALGTRPPPPPPSSGSPSSSTGARTPYRHLSILVPIAPASHATGAPTVIPSSSTASSSATPASSGAEAAFPFITTALRAPPQAPTGAPPAPSHVPTGAPTPTPHVPTGAPTETPSSVSTGAPTETPSSVSTGAPTPPAHDPTGAPTPTPHVPTGAPTPPAHDPTGAPTPPAHVPTGAPTPTPHVPTGAPTETPSSVSTGVPAPPLVTGSRKRKVRSPWLGPPKKRVSPAPTSAPTASLVSTRAPSPPTPPTEPRP